MKADPLKRPVGPSPHDVQCFYRSFHYRAKSCSHPRRVIAKVERHPGDCSRVSASSPGICLGNFLCAFATPEAVAHWLITSLREKLIEIGSKVVVHGRYLTFQPGEVAIPRSLFAAIMQRIAALRSPPMALAP